MAALGSCRNWPPTLHRNAKRRLGSPRWRSPLPRWRGALLRRHRAGLAGPVVVLPAAGLRVRAAAGHRGIATAGGRPASTRLPAASAVLVFLSELQRLLSADADVSGAVAAGSRTIVLRLRKTSVRRESAA